MAFTCVFCVFMLHLFMTGGGGGGGLSKNSIVQMSHSPIGTMQVGSGLPLEHYAEYSF